MGRVSLFHAYAGVVPDQFGGQLELVILRHGERVVPLGDIPFQRDVHVVLAGHGKAPFGGEASGPGGEGARLVEQPDESPGAVGALPLRAAMYVIDHDLGALVTILVRPPEGEARLALAGLDRDPVLAHA